MNRTEIIEGSRSRTRLWLSVFIFGIVVIDQAIKFWVKTTMPLYDEIYVTNWFQIYFIENKGMAFGMEMFSKIFLTLFRVVACGGLIYYIHYLLKKNFGKGYIFTVGAILAGAMGNLVDCIFYGKIFSHSVGQVAEIFPAGGGYGNWLEGKVVDMFYFPLITDASGKVIFFQPVFNFADSAVTIGMFLIIIFFRKELEKSL